MDELTYDKVEEEKNPKIKQLYWDIAFGLQDVDGLKPSKYMKELSREHIRGKKTYQEVQHEITSYYRKNKDNHDDDEEEADEVATAIYEILSDKSFRFDYLTFKNYHKRLFTNLDKEKYNPGEFRTYNLTKDEPILNGDTVQYQSYDLIEETLKYDFNEEKEIDYTKFSEEGLINRMVEFTSRIWQVHPFQEGNTRTTAVFIQKYLISMGFNINNELFKENALYFRNALVRANYTNYSKGIKETNKYLIMFFENLLLQKNNNLNNDDLKISNMLNMKVKLNDVIEALEFANGGMDNIAYLNPKTYEIVYINDYMDISDEEKEKIYDEYIALPTKYYIDEYSMVKEFIKTIDDDKIYNQLYIAINGKGAFKRFKDTCINFNIINNWYKFRYEKYRELAMEWCKNNNIEYILD